MGRLSLRSRANAIRGLVEDLGQRRDVWVAYKIQKDSAPNAISVSVSGGHLQHKQSLCCLL